MKRVFLAVLLVLAVCSSAFALSDKEYTQLRRTSREFARADRELNQVWDSLKDKLTAREFNELKREQAAWVKSGRDAYARRKMREDGYSKAEAYAEATQARADYLRENYLY